MKRLCNIVIRSDLEADHCVDHVGSAGDHDDARIRSRPNLLRECQAILSRKDQIQEDEVDAFGHQRLAHPGASFGSGHAEALILEIARQHRADASLVIHNQNMRFMGRLHTQAGSPNGVTVGLTKVVPNTILIMPSFDPVTSGGRRPHLGQHSSRAAVEP